MKYRTRALSLTALSVAGAVVILYMGTIFPAMHLTFAALAAIFVAAAVIEGGLKYGVLCFTATATLGLFLVPDRVGVLLYLSFFGAYPLVKSIAERQSAQILGWVVKFTAFFLTLTLYMTLLRELMLGAIPFTDRAIWLVYLAGAAAFLVYDIGMSKLIGFYLERLYKYRR